MNIDLASAIISAITSFLVVIISHVLIRQNERKQLLEKDRDNYINPIRFMLSENYYRMKEILNHIEKNGKDERILFIDEAEEVIDKDESWYVECGCFLISSCYFTACLMAYIENLRRDIPFLKISRRQDAKLIGLINKMVVDFSKNLNIFYVIQMNIVKDCYIDQNNRIITYREFCRLIQNKENFIWYKSLINYYLRIGRGECNTVPYLMEHMRELAKYLDNIVSGGDSIKQKLLAEKESRQKVV